MKEKDEEDSKEKKIQIKLKSEGNSKKIQRFKEDSKKIQRRRLKETEKNRRKKFSLKKAEEMNHR